jgi:putative endonuclease
MREEKRYYVYIMASRSRTLYRGVTGDLYHRALQHKRGEIEGFTQRCHINRLVYYEEFKYIDNAIKREKQIKAWSRAKRLALIKSENPAWQDLAEGWGEPIKLHIPSTAPGAPRAVRDDNAYREVDVRGSVDTSQPAAQTGSASTILQIPRSQNQGSEGSRQPVRVARDDNSYRGEGEQKSASVSKASTSRNATRNIA